MIAFTCSACGKRLEVKDEHGGKKARCSACGAVVAVPQKSRDRDEAGEQIHGERASLDDLAAAVQRTGRGQARGQQERQIRSESAPAPSVGPAGVGFKRRRHKLTLVAVLVCLVVCTLGGIVGIVAFQRFGAHVRGRVIDIADRVVDPRKQCRVVDVRKVIANPDAYTKQTLISRVQILSPSAFGAPHSSSLVPLMLCSSDEIQEKTWRIIMAVGRDSVLIKYRIHDKQTVAKIEAAAEKSEACRKLAMRAFAAERAVRDAERLVAKAENAEIVRHSELMRKWPDEARAVQRKDEAVSEAERKLNDAAMEVDRANTEVARAEKEVTAYKERVQQERNEARKAKTPELRRFWLAHARHSEELVAEAEAEAERARATGAETTKKLEALNMTVRKLRDEARKARERLVEKAKAQLDQAAKEADALASKAKTQEESLDKKNLPYGIGRLLDIWIP